jgi:hypothetical protein
MGFNEFLQACFDGYREAKKGDIKQRQYDSLSWYDNIVYRPDTLTHLYDNADTEDQRDQVIDWMNENYCYEFDGYKPLYNKHIERRR